MTTENYEDIEQRMKFWRMGLETLKSTGYIKYHKELAQEQKKVLEDFGWTIRAEWTEDQGWFDGMNVVWLIVEKYFPKKGLVLKKLSWQDSHSKGSYSEHNSGSWYFKYDGSYSDLIR